MEKFSFEEGGVLFFDLLDFEGGSPGREEVVSVVEIESGDVGLAALDVEPCGAFTEEGLVSYVFVLVACFSCFGVMFGGLLGGLKEPGIFGVHEKLEVEKIVGGVFGPRFGLLQEGLEFSLVFFLCFGEKHGMDA